MYSEEQTKLMRVLACMLHGTLFGTLYELRKEKGFFGVWEYVTRGLTHILAGYLTKHKNLSHYGSELLNITLYHDNYSCGNIWYIVLTSKKSGTSLGLVEKNCSKAFLVSLSGRGLLV